MTVNLTEFLENLHSFNASLGKYFTQIYRGQNHKQNTLDKEAQPWFVLNASTSISTCT